MLDAAEVVAKVLDANFDQPFRDTIARRIVEALREEGFIVAHESLTACATHDGMPMTAEEEQRWDDGDDPCQHVLRLHGETGKVVTKEGVLVDA